MQPWPSQVLLVQAVVLGAGVQKRVPEFNPDLSQVLLGQVAVFVQVLHVQISA